MFIKYIWVYCHLVRRASHETNTDNIYKIINFNTATSSTFCMSILSLWWLIAVTGCLFLCHGRALCWASSIQLLHCHFIRMQAWHDCIYLNTCIPQEVKHCTSCSQSIASIFEQNKMRERLCAVGCKKIILQMLLKLGFRSKRLRIEGIMCEKEKCIVNKKSIDGIGDLEIQTHILGYGMGKKEWRMCDHNRK